MAFHSGVPIVGDAPNEQWLFDDTESWVGTDKDFYWLYDEAGGNTYEFWSANGPTQLISIPRASNIWSFLEEVAIVDDKKFYYGDSGDIYSIYESTGDTLDFYSATGPALRFRISKAGGCQFFDDQTTYWGTSQDFGIIYDETTDDAWEFIGGATPLVKVPKATNLWTHYGNVQYQDDVTTAWGDDGAGTDFHTLYQSAGPRQQFIFGGTECLAMASSGTFFRESTRPLYIYDNVYEYYGNNGDWYQFYDESGDDVLKFASKSIAGVTAGVMWEMPIIAGGSGSQALRYVWKFDGTIEAGLIAETDGSGSYREPVWQVPHYDGAYNADWSGFTAPTPTGLVDGGMFIAYNSDGGGQCRIYCYSNSGWRYVNLT
jgi:hypothetical protein